MANAGYIAKVSRDWDIPQGADTTNAFTYSTKVGGVTTPVALVTDGWSARAQIRPAAGQTEWVTFLSSSTTGPRIELTDEGYVYVILPSDTTQDSSWNNRFVGFYDVELVDSTGFVVRLARGQVNVTHDYTRTE